MVMSPSHEPPCGQDWHFQLLGWAVSLLLRYWSLSQLLGFSQLRSTQEDSPPSFCSNPRGQILQVKLGFTSWGW